MSEFHSSPSNQRTINDHSHHETSYGSYINQGQHAEIIHNGVVNQYGVSLPQGVLTLPLTILTDLKNNQRNSSGIPLPVLVSILLHASILLVVPSPHALEFFKT